jgi:hypothetical protein
MIRYAAIVLLVLALCLETVYFVHDIDKHLKHYDLIGTESHSDAVTVFASRMGVKCSDAAVDLAIAPDAGPALQRAIDTVRDWQRMNGANIDFVFPPGICYLKTELWLDASVPGHTVFRDGDFWWAGRGEVDAVFHIAAVKP